MNKYQSSTEQVVQKSSYADRQFLHTFVAGAVLPLVQASITAVVMMIATVLVLYMFNAIDFIKPVFVIGGLTWVFAWLALQRRWLRLTDLEKFFNQDFNNDNHIGEPPVAAKIHVQVDEVTHEGHIRQASMFDLPCTEQQLQALSIGILKDHKTLAEKEWTGSGKPFSIKQFREVRSEMIKMGMVVPASSKAEQQGFVFTRAGEAVLRHYTTSPSPIFDGE